MPAKKKHPRKTKPIIDRTIDWPRILSFVGLALAITLVAVTTANSQARIKNLDDGLLECQTQADIQNRILSARDVIIDGLQEQVRESGRTIKRLTSERLKARSSHYNCTQQSAGYECYKAAR